MNESNTAKIEEQESLVSNNLTVIKRNYVVTSDADVCENKDPRLKQRQENAIYERTMCGNVMTVSFARVKLFCHWIRSFHITLTSGS